MKYILLFLGISLFAACKTKEPVSLTGDERVSFADFREVFPIQATPLSMADSTMLRKERDSSAISRKLFTQFVPDSILTTIFGKSKPKLFPMGQVKGDAIYLFVKAVAPDKRGAWVFAFDKKDKLLGYMPFLVLDGSAATQQSGMFDGKYAVYKSITRKNADGTISDGKDVYDLDPATGQFNLVFTDALDDKIPDLVNPIDTFSRKQKFTGDYGPGKTNMLSFRDGRRADRISFFMHMEKAGACSGELKGEAIMRTATMAEYREAGDPCAIQFSFTASAVTVREIEGCGAHRGLRCSFNGTFVKKKVIKAKASKK